MSPRNALLFGFHPAGAVRPAPHLRQLLLRAGNVGENPGPIYCPGCSKAIRHDFIPLVCIACRQSFHRTCSGLTRAQSSRLSLRILPWKCHRAVTYAFNLRGTESFTTRGPNASATWLQRDSSRS